MTARLLYRVLPILLISLAFGHRSLASHLRAGEITVQRVNCSALTFRITITVFTNTKTDARFGGDQDVSYMYFGDGDKVFIPEQPNVVRLDLDPEGNIATSSFTVQHTYDSYRTYKISYQEPNRNGGVLNMDNSLNTLFYIETVMNLDLFLDSKGGCSNSPRLLVPPIDRACSGATWTHNPGAFDPDSPTFGDSLSYEMVVPNSAEGINVNNYRDPNTAEFYDDPTRGNEEKNSTPKFSINAVTGKITWDAPGFAGEYNIAFVVKEWRKISGVTYLMGYVRRDMQIIVEDCENRRPRLQVPEEICVVAGTTIRLNVIGTDPDAHDDMVKIEAFSEIFNLAPAQSPAHMIYSPPDTLKPKYELKPTSHVFFQWKTQCSHIRAGVYQVVFKVTDDPPPGKGAKLATFETMTIRVVGPAPEWTGATLNPTARSVQLNWESYGCSNAEFIKVYRRVDSFPFTPDECETGLPAYAGYQQIKVLPVSTLSFTDNDNGRGLSAGAKYCYRLVAQFPLSKGESIVSEEVCVGPFEVNAPVITNVSVRKTDPAAGEIFVRWTRPFQRAGVYEYKVYRAEGFAGPIPTSSVPVGTFTDQDTTFTDVGLDTETNVYRYRVDAHIAAGGALSDSSKIASSVRLDARSLLNKIEISWNAVVPWSNQFVAAPGMFSKHLIYRGPENAVENELVLIDSVDVTTGSFTYTDGNTVPLESNKVYSYRIMTRGTYGNSAIANPVGSRTDPPRSLINFSQILEAQPGDETPPCQPLAPLAKDPISCEEYIAQSATCNNKNYDNTITWERPDDAACRNDIAYYNIYAANSTTGEYILIKTNERSTTYIDANLPSYARCYKISAVDRSGNESEMSNAVCFDNCPYYELPNMFSPNQDDCNGKFSAFSGNDRYLIDRNSETPAYLCDGITEQDLHKCARFVERVVFKVYNRWGKEVYAYSGFSGNEVNSIYIDWDGLASDGSELAAGVYYYVADVTFTSVDPSKRQKAIKGWVHLLR